jgi:hypothetical protein
MPGTAPGRCDFVTWLTTTTEWSADPRVASPSSVSSIAGRSQAVDKGFVALAQRAVIGTPDHVHNHDERTSSHRHEGKYFAAALGILVESLDREGVS